MDADKIILAFINVVSEQDFVFDDVAISNIPTLRENLASLQPVTVESVYEVLRLWYINHESVRDAVLIEEREVSKAKKPSPVNQENILENRDRILEDTQKLHDSKKKQDSSPK